VPNVRDEVAGLLQRCEWYRVYDIIEAAHRYLVPHRNAETFATLINELFGEEGIGWQLTEGRIVTRGPREFEHAVAQAVAAAEEGGLHTARGELEEARRDLSKRPDPDVTGTIQHCIAALECTMRAVTGNERATLGDLVQRHAAVLGIPPPLDRAIDKMWGYASEMGRHLREGRVPSRAEAELLLGISAAVVSYLLTRNHL
jgi:hypothetical protein